MGERKHLSDAWFYWDPEQLEAFPHSNSAEPQPLERLPGENGQRAKPLQLKLIEDMLMYAAGLASAMAGIGLVILLGSFISAYSVLTETHRGDAGAIADFPPTGTQRTAPTAGADTAASKGVFFGRVAEKDGQLSLLETPIDVSRDPGAQKPGL